MPTEPKLALYLRFWAWIYRRTDYVHNCLYVYKYHDLRLYIRYLAEKDELVDPLSLDIRMGMQDLSLGLSTSSDHMVWPDDSLTDKIIKRIRRLFNI